MWPVALVFFEGKRLVAAWCELRQDFRHFRADRISSLESTGVRYPRPRRELAKLWRQQLQSSDRAKAAAIARS